MAPSFTERLAAEQREKAFQAELATRAVGGRTVGAGPAGRGKTTSPITFPGGWLLQEEEEEVEMEGEEKERAGELAQLRIPFCLGQSPSSTLSFNRLPNTGRPSGWLTWWRGSSTGSTPPRNVNTRVPNIKDLKSENSIQKEDRDLMATIKNFH